MKAENAEFKLSRILYFVSIPTLTCLMVMWAIYRHPKVTPLSERCMSFNAVGSVSKACEKSTNGGLSYFWAADMYGHLNIVVGKGHQVYYHTLYRDLDMDPCHHLNIDRTQLAIYKTDFQQCDMNRLGAVIQREQIKKRTGTPFIVTFSFADGAKYADMIAILDMMDQYAVKIYSMRELTGNETVAINRLGQ